MINLGQLEHELTTAYHGAMHPVWSKDEAKALARMVHEDMTTAAFNLELTAWPPIRIPGFQPIVVPAYKLERTDYGPQKLHESNQTFKASGPMLDGGHLLRLARACKLGRELLSTKWPARFAKRLRNPKEHPTLIEEILWLGRWHSPTKVASGVKLVPGSKKDVDWGFDCCGRRINLEAKFRRRDWMAVTDGPSFSREFDSYFEDARGKFSAARSGELNLLGITTFAQPDSGLRACTNRFLRDHPEVNGVIFWSLHAPNGDSLEVHSANDKQLIESFLKIQNEDHLLCLSPILHPWNERDTRKAARSSRPNLPGE
jgi:hypothetical protein